MTPTRTRGVVIGLAAAAGFVGALADVAPTTVGWTDHLWAVLLCAAPVVVARRRPTRAVLWLTAITVAVAVSAGLLLVAIGLVAVALAVAAASVSSNGPARTVASALAAAIAVPALLYQGPWGFHGASALAVVVALAPLAWAPAQALGRAAVQAVRGWGRRRRWLVAGLVAAPILAVAMSTALAAWAGAEMRDGLASARTGDTDAGSAQLHAARQGFTVAHWITAGPLAPLRAVPLVSQHLGVLDTVTGEGAAISRAGDDVLRVGSYDQLKTTDGRLDLDRLRALVAPVERVQSRLGSARRHTAQRASPWLVGPARSRLDGLLGELDEAGEQADLVGQLARTVPGMLGGDGERVWFVAFVNPAEQRGGGGFLGSYAELRAVDGKISMTRSGSVTELIAAAPPGARSLDGPPEYLARYGSFHPEDFFQDVTFSPHFPDTADVIAQLYPQSGGTELDGVLSVDPVALAALLRFTGPIAVDGLDVPLTADNAAEEILRGQYVRFDTKNQEGQSARRDVLDALAGTTFRRLVDGGLPGPRALADTLGPMVGQRRLQAHAERPAEQRLLERVGLDGSMEARQPGDYLMVSHQNLGNSKIDTYLLRRTRYEAAVDPVTGETTATVTIDLVNTAPAEGLPVYVIGNNRGEPTGSNVMQLSVYSHLAARTATIDGAPLSFRPGTEAGARVVTARVVVGPGQRRTVVVRLAGQIELPGGRYRLRVVPQPPALAADTFSAEVRTATPSGEPGSVIAERPAGPLEAPEVVEAPTGG